jgi:hypothetical protein
LRTSITTSGGMLDDVSHILERLNEQMVGMPMYKLNTLTLNDTG